MSTDSDFDIAIVGLACRFPGAADAEQFWRNLLDGVDSIERLSESDLRASEVPESLWRRPDYVRASPVLAEPAAFDAEFFGYTPGEAAALDPQHRLLLELAQSALDDAGLDPSRAPGRIAVYAGAAMNTYFVDRCAGDGLATNYIPTLIASDKDFLATRLSYKLGLKGPSVTIQTACSTSLVAVHQARQSLLCEESDIALAAAASVRFPHRAGYLYDGSGVVSPSGRVAPFGAEANGTVFGSGGAVVVLKRLADALVNQDRIYAVIKGSAINNDGDAKAGYTAPSVSGQADVVAEALANAGLSADDITYVEAHGSGTPVGDRIEFSALTDAFRRFTARTGFCALGSVKSNLGHLDAAAGMAGLIKTALALRHGRLPASLHSSPGNPEIAFEESPFYLAAQAEDWPKCERPRRAGVMATGMGGTNAYIVLEEAPAPEPLATQLLEPQLLALSATSEAALTSAGTRFRRWSETALESVSIAPAAETLARGRRQFSFRRAAVSRTLREAGRLLDEPLFSGRLPADGPLPVAFLLPGVGDQYPGMGRGLYSRFPIFRETIDHCADLLAGSIGCDLRTVLYPPLAEDSGSPRPAIDLKQLLRRGEPDGAASDRPIDRTLLAQCSLFCTEYALARLWMDLGVAPARLVSHSLGEWVAACLAGVFALPEALMLVAQRARLVESLPAAAMTAVLLGERELSALLDPELAIALVNGPALCVIAGSLAATRRLQERLKARGTLFRAVRNGHPFHTAQLQAVAGGLRALFKGVPLSRPQIPFLSSLTGDWIEAEQAADPEYWVRQTCSPARFADGLNQLWQLPEHILLEAGPGRTLGTLAMQHPARGARMPPLLYSLRPDYEHRDDATICLEAAARLWVQGVPLKMERLFSQRLPTADLPGYAFQRRTHWLERANSSPAQPLAARYWIPTWEIAPLSRRDPSQETAGRVRSHLLRFDPANETVHRLAERVRELAIHGEAPVRVAIVTRLSHSVTGSEITNPAGAQALGPALVLPREYPGLVAFVIDVDDAVRDEDIEADAEAAHSGDLIAWRGRRRWIRRLRPRDLSESTALGLPKGAYVVTGGTGGIGFELAKCLAAECGARIALIARRAPSQAWSASASDSIDQLGGRLSVWQADVADRDAVRRAIAEIRAQWGPIRGVVHAAGTRQDRSLEMKTAEEMASVLAPKVGGTDHLYAAVAGDPLEFFIGCSSVSSLVGFHGQTDYAAANAFLDAFVSARSVDAPFAVQAIHWPVWREVGMAVGTHLAEQGISTAEGIEIFRRVLGSRQSQVAFLPHGLETLEKAAARTAIADSPIASGPAGAEPSESSADVVEASIARLWREVMGKTGIHPKEDFLAIGGHSLLAMRIVGRIRETYAIDFSLRDFFDAPTIAGNAAAVQEAIWEEIERLEPNHA
ncbi:MAG TPA: type I polyketide synthase [Opitutaceae bacterium]